MKTKIIFISIVGIIVFVVSSFQSVENKQDYTSIIKNTNKFNLKQQKLYVATAVARCAKCHNCQKDNSMGNDSLKINIQNYFKKIKSYSNEIPKTEKTQIKSEKVDFNTDEYPDNFKIEKR
jgi:thioredoxin-related protein